MKKMKVTNSYLIAMSDVLDKFSAKKLPQKISYAITKNIMAVQKEYQVYDKQLHKLFDNYSDHIDKDDNGNIKTDKHGIPIIKDESVRKEFNAQILELLNIETEIEFYTVANETIFDYEDKGIYDPLSPRDIMTLQGILCDNDEEEDSSAKDETKDTDEK